MLINDAANKYSISVRTLRYYEEQGLLKPTRNDSNIRTFSDEQLKTLEDILLLKTFNFSLAEIKEILFTDTNILKERITSELNQIESDLQELSHKQRLIKSLLLTYGSSDITRQTLREFATEQLYFKNERIIKMITKAENIVLEISEDLIPLATSEAGISLIPEIKALRIVLKEENDIDLDTLRIKDNIESLRTSEFQIIQNGHVLFKDSVKGSNPEGQVNYIISTLKQILLQ